MRQTLLKLQSNKCTTRLIKMVQIAGKYLLDKNENFKEYLMAIGLPENLSEMAQSVGKEITVSVDGKKYTFDDGTKPSVFTLDVEYDEPIEYKQIVLKSKATMKGNIITITSTTPEGIDAGVRIYEFTDKGCVYTLIHKGITAKRYYKRA